MFFLPAIHGRFPVGVSTFVTPVYPARPIGSVKLRNGSKTNQPHHALYLEEVAFTAYYPADVTSKSIKKGVDWFIRPIRESLHGFAAFLGVPPWLLWPVIYLFGSLLKIPAYPNAPLLNPNVPDQNTRASQWPLVIFSHGLGGSRTAYSQFCCRIAASGRVVLAVEHRDGTGTVSMPRSWHLDGKKSEPRTILYLRESDIHWDDNDSIQTQLFPLRAEQLAFRHHEVYIAYNTFRKFIHKDETVKVETIDGSEFDRKSWLLDNPGQGLVKSDRDVILAGHSFGGCTALSILSTKPTDEYLPIPITHAVLLDPWLEPLPTPGPIPLLTKHNGVSTASIDGMVESIKSSLEGSVVQGDPDIPVSPHPRMMVINSETFTLWKDHFARLQEIVAGWEPEGKHIFTLVASQHVSFSDFPVLPVISRRHARPILDRIVNLSIAFLDDKLDQFLDSEDVPIINMNVDIIGVKKDGKPKRRIIGNPGDVIVN